MRAVVWAIAATSCSPSGAHAIDFVDARAPAPDSLFATVCELIVSPGNGTCGADAPYCCGDPAMTHAFHCTWRYSPPSDEVECREQVRGRVQTLCLTPDSRCPGDAPVCCTEPLGLESELSLCTDHALLGWQCDLDVHALTSR